jgi:hypothetical protein
MDDLRKFMALDQKLTSSLHFLKDYFKIFMGFPTTGGAAPPQGQK